MAPKLEQLMQPTMVNDFVKLGKDSKIWRNCNVYGTNEEPVIIGENTQIGHGSEIKPGVIIGDNCRFQYGLFVPEGISFGDYVFVGPRVTFTNDKYPDIAKTLYQTWSIIKTHVSSFASIGGGAIILPGANIGLAAQIGGGSVVTKPIPEYKIVVGNPAKIVGDIRDQKVRSRYFRSQYAALFSLINERGQK